MASLTWNKTTIKGLELYVPDPLSEEELKSMEHAQLYIPGFSEDRIRKLANEQDRNRRIRSTAGARKAPCPDCGKLLRYDGIKKHQKRIHN